MIGCIPEALPETMILQWIYTSVGPLRGCLNLFNFSFTRMMLHLSGMIPNGYETVTALTSEMMTSDRSDGDAPAICNQYIGELGNAWSTHDTHGNQLQPTGRKPCAFHLAVVTLLGLSMFMDSWFFLSVKLKQTPEDVAVDYDQIELVVEEATWLPKKYVSKRPPAWLRHGHFPIASILCRHGPCAMAQGPKSWGERSKHLGESSNLHNLW